MILPKDVQIIHKYPFIHGNYAVTVAGKPENWKRVVQNLHVLEEYEILFNLSYDVQETGPRTLIVPIPVHGHKLTSSKEIRALTVGRHQAVEYPRVQADGALVEFGEVCVFASGDCPTVGLHDPVSKKTFMLHGSRETILFQGIVERALAHFNEQERARLIATISLGIHPDNFLHEWSNPSYGEKNREVTEMLLQEYGPGAISAEPELGGINLSFIIATKLMRAGLKARNIYADRFDSFSDGRFWSNRASQKPGNPKYKEAGRNIVMIANRL